MRIPTIIITAASLLAFASLAKADDHLVNALEHGLNPDGQPFQENPTGRSGDEAPGQGSPFAGIDKQTPSTETDAANLHANIKVRVEK